MDIVKCVFWLMMNQKIININLFFSYGLTENVDGHLVGTSFHNFDMPLIRYDTGDLIASENRKGQLMEAFSITQGRNANALSDSYLIFSCFLYN